MCICVTAAIYVDITNGRAFEILTVFASRLGPVAVSAQSIMLQLSVLCFMLPLGLSISTSSMVRPYCLRLDRFLVELFCSSEVNSFRVA